MASSEHGGRPPGYEDANKYTQVIVDEALGRGIDVVILDPSIGELELTRGERRIRTIESLSELTHAVAFRRCDDKLLTRRVLTDAGLRVPAGRVSTSDADDVAFLRHHGEIVVKPRRGEQGWGVTVGVVDEDGLVRAVAAAHEVADDVLLERCHHGADLRIVVIGGEVVAASERRPPPGHRRRATDGGRARRRARRGPRARDARRGGSALDDLTRDVVAAAGHSLDDVLPDGVELMVRRTANVHTGGTIDDVTDELHPELGAVAVRAAAALDIPVVGLDLIVPSPGGTEYVIIEAQRAAGTRQPRAEADRRALRRPAVPRLTPAARRSPDGADRRGLALWRPWTQAEPRPRDRSPASPCSSWAASDRFPCSPCSSPTWARASSASTPPAPPTAPSARTSGSTAATSR